VKGIENLLQQSGVKIIPEEGRFIDEKKLELASGEIMEYDNAIIATGSRNRNLTNVIVDDKNILDSTSALALTEIPKSILIIGAGAIGLEMGLIFQRLGAEVTIVEIMAEILPGMDPELSQMLRTVLVRNDLNFHLNSSVREINSTPSGNFEVKISNLESPVLVEKILLSAGRIPNVEAVQKLELSRNPGAYIQIDENFSTSIPQVKAIGDVTGPPLLAHKASHQGIMAVEIIAGRKDLSHFPPIPAAVFTEPEFACVGLTYQQAKEKNLEPEENIFPLAAVSRARTLDAPEGAFKIVSDRKGKILGVHILAPHAGELIAQASLAMHKELKVKDLANTICVHPTLSEGLMESALLADHRPLHI
jgi:dihydrolipoamide dehydrogenase